MNAVEKNFLHLLTYFQYFDLSPFDKPVSHIYRTPFVFLCFLWICIFMFDFLLEVYLQWGHLNFLLEEFTFCPLYLLLLLEYKKRSSISAADVLQLKLQHMDYYWLYVVLRYDDRISRGWNEVTIRGSSKSHFLPCNKYDIISE